MKHASLIEATHRDTSIGSRPDQTQVDHTLPLVRTASTINYLFDELGINHQSATIPTKKSIPNLHIFHITSSHHRTPGDLCPTGGVE
jgi:hypothetical protein